ncbi:MAG: methylated-DNA--[protein]-cysteine S-methyltransferase [Bacteroidota bacterium]|nr:methylated-DNA--[protein]-cysteine S-methyltransferase [Bacteroidota bacterium]
MAPKDSYMYDQVALAIEYINTHYAQQPDLDSIAREIHMSPFHFQRTFTEWAGVSPKKFLQFITIEHAKKILDSKASIFDAALDAGLSGTGRLQDLFINIEGMTPGEYKNGGRELVINYSYTESPFGSIMTASTTKGICHMSFAENKKEALHELKQRFPNAKFNHASDALQDNAVSLFNQDWSKPNKIKLHLKGTDFQLKVWNALLRVPMGSLTTYGDIAQAINNPKASRAVGSAVGDNPVAFLVPCHRVIRSTGLIGDYHWGQTRKSAIIGWEAVKTQPNVDEE